MPDVTPPEPWTIKLERAATHVDDLRTRIGSYLDSGNVRVEVEEAAEQVFNLRLRFSELPDSRWPAMIGDALHNVRSALDSVTWAVVARSLPRELTVEEERRVQFPICASHDHFKRSRWAPRDIPKSVSKPFLGMQPFADIATLGLAQAEVTAAINNHPLSVLQRWSNLDKHRGLHPMVCAVDLLYVGLQEGETSEWIPVDSWPWADGSVIARVQISGGSSRGTPEFGDRLAVTLEEDSGPLRAPPVADRLAGLIGHADWVVYSLRQSVGGL